MEVYNEQVVKRVNKAKNTMIKALAIFLLIAVPLLCFALAFVITFYMFYVGFFLFLGGIYAVWYVFSSQRVEFEYAVNGDELNIAKIISLRKRKKLCRLNIREIERLEIGEKSVQGMKFSKTFVAARDIDCDSENYYAVFNSPAYGKSLLIFSPNEKILLGMKPYLSKDIVIKLFYKRNK